MLTHLTRGKPRTNKIKKTYTRETAEGIKNENKIINSKDIDKHIYKEIQGQRTLTETMDDKIRIHTDG